MSFKSILNYINKSQYQHLFYKAILVADQSRLGMWFCLGMIDLGLGKYKMGKQKQGGLKVCYCQQYRFEEKQLKSMIIDKLQCVNECGQWSNQKLLKFYFQHVEQKNKYYESVNQMLRNFIKHEPTIHYSQHDTVKTMVESIISKIKKQREVHQYVIKQQTKQHATQQQQATQQQTLFEQMQYLKELLKEQQTEVEDLKAQLQCCQQNIQQLRKQVEQLQIQNGQLKLEIKQQKEIRKKSSLKMFGLERDNSYLSNKVCQKSEEMGHLKNHLQAQITRLQYESKLQTERQLEAFQNQVKLRQTQPKEDKTQQQPQYAFKSKFQNMYSSKAASNLTPLQNRSMSHKAMNLDTTLSLTRSGSSKHGISSKIWTQKNIPLQKHNRQQIFNHLFVGDVLLSQHDMRIYLVQLLQKYRKNLMLRTRLLYRLDYLNNVNIHRYVDGHPNIVFLFKADYGQLIAAYSRGAFRARSISNHFGLLISLNNRIQFKNTKRAIMYDQGEIIFGNYDLRYKTGDNKISSNFGMAGSFYEDKEQSFSVLFGEGKREGKNREVKIRYLEVFQLIFSS